MDRSDTDTSQRRTFLSPTARRLIRSYGLLILIAIAFLLMALMVREKDETVPAQSGRFQHVTTVGVIGTALR